MYFLSHIVPLSQEFTVYFKSQFAARCFNLIVKGFEDGMLYLGLPSLWTFVRHLLF